MSPEVYSEQRGRDAVHERSLLTCEACGRKRAESIHHRRKRSHGGLWAPANLLDVCGSGTTGCHGRIESEPILSAVLGLHIADDSDPSTVPVWLDRVTWVGPAWWLLGSPEPDLTQWVDLPAPPVGLWTPRALRSGLGGPR